MIYFAIPLRSKQASKDWELVQKLFNRTLWSVYNQTDPDFKILIGYHDMPKLYHDFDDRVEFVQMQYPAPQDTREQMLDKYYKKRVVMQRVAELGGGYTMFVDDDDLISNKISAFVNTDRNPNGYFVKTGYDHFYWPDKYKISFKFHGVCGTCCVINFKKEELPSPDLKYEGYDIEKKEEFIFDLNHRKWVGFMNSNNRPLQPLPFKAAIATLNTSENYSQNFQGLTKRDLLRKYMPGFKASDKMKKEFSIK